MGDGDKPSKIEAVPLTDDNKKLFVGGLSPNTKKDDLSKYFEQWGKVTHAAVKTDRYSNEPRGFGFVVMDSEECIEKILAQKDHYIHNKRIDPKPARPSKDIRRKVFVGGLDPDLDEDKVREYFGKFGVIEIFEFPYDTAKSKRRPFAFITYATNVEAKAATKQEKHIIEGKKCEVRIATPPELLKSRKWAMDSYNHMLSMYSLPHYMNSYWPMHPFQGGMPPPSPYGPYYPPPGAMYGMYDMYAGGMYGPSPSNQGPGASPASYYNGIPSSTANNSRTTGMPPPPPPSGSGQPWGGQPLPQQAGYRSARPGGPLPPHFRQGAPNAMNGSRPKHI